jgi:hypothetical protein
MLPDLQPGTPDVFQERFFSVLERAYACLSAAAQKGVGVAAVLVPPHAMLTCGSVFRTLALTARSTQADLEGIRVLPRSEVASALDEITHHSLVLTRSVRHLAPPPTGAASLGRQHCRRRVAAAGSCF